MTKKIEQYRERLREQGLRPVQILVPDIRKEGFSEECRRQSLLLQDDSLELEVNEWLGESADSDDWE